MNYAMSPVCPIGRWYPPAGLSHTFPSFAEIAKVLPLFLSFCVSVSRHREERPDTSSGGRGVSKVPWNERGKILHTSCSCSWR
jgi:hypothetical protein